MDIHVLILTFLIIFMLHNLEEIITIERWFKNTYPRIRGRIPVPVQKVIDDFSNITAAQFAVAVLMISLVASLLLIITVTTQHYFLFLGLNMLFAINIFTHPIQSLLLRCYTPGVWTTLLLILPYNIIFFYHFYIEGLLTRNMILSGLVVMVICMPFVFLGHKIAEKWK
ncbi:HXXEE domain-containing protein [Virgibacillus pantothenticus]|uniref:HXXEE domain-containing protein n=1 Tax=Virgibacillus pantothenticus TaxID=1473 RepID=UPI000987CA35|nr:HXXEE domain-containing protein [Virgibacillus pantothenticus]